MLMDSAFIPDHYRQHPLVDICFESITYTVQVQKQMAGELRKQSTTRTILDNVSGIIPAGEVTAIMGASGAGKTTLLNVLACRVPSQNLSGNVYANDNKYSFEDFGDFGNYVMQQDVLMQTLTVRQTLQFAANLKLSYPLEVKDKRIDQLCRQLKLQKCMNVLVGGVIIKGISGGERKRTSIAFELISDPQVIILDQPTSGLDSLASFIIVRYLKKLANQSKKTVLMSIHQPNSDTFALFDRLILMVQGRLIYQGANSQTIQYFAQQFGLRCPDFSNPPDYLMSIMHQQDQENRLRYSVYFQKYALNFQHSILKQINQRRKESIDKRVVQVTASKVYKTLIYRDYINILRNPLLVKARFFQTIFMSLFGGGVFFAITKDLLSLSGWAGLQGFSLFLGANSLMLAMGPVAIVFPLQRNVFLKEQGSKLYGVGAYFISRNLIELPYSLLFPIIQSLVFYWMVGLSPTVQQFFTFYLILYLTGFTGASLGMLIGSLSKDSKGVIALLPVFLFLFLIFSGLFKNLAGIPEWIGWLQYLSPIKYNFAALLQNQVLFSPSSRVGQLNLNTGVWLSIGLLAALSIIYRILAFFFLWKLKSKLE